MSIKAAIKSALRPAVRGAWPAIEAAALAGARVHAGRAQVEWFTAWNDRLDAALEAMPPMPECGHDVYRALLKETGVPKRHALVSENGAPIAVISLRQRRHFWEPVTYQCIPKQVAPAVNAAALGRALKALGLEVRVEGGMGENIAELSPTKSWAYEWRKVDLKADYEAHWREKKRQYTIRRARKTLAQVTQRVDGAGDVEWIVDHWRGQWAQDESREVVAAPDRMNFWPALMAASARSALKLHSLQLMREDKRMAGLVFTSIGSTAMIQCGGADLEFDDDYARAAVLIAAIEWAKSAGFDTLDIAGGPAKRYWGPVGGQRYGGLFRGPIVAAFAWVMPQ
ncbi:MAG TPA: GNAT family N-acetyltransferase [Terricaulis sp.]|nr:GNAT family N-acetyltransferase [Terricaulis sp.]HRP09682.1 GNAT family N-acetyltransferase [Terricaulis sp.]